MHRIEITGSSFDSFYLPTKELLCNQENLTFRLYQSPQCPAIMLAKTCSMQCQQSYRQECTHCIEGIAD